MKKAKECYTIIRKHYGKPDYLNVDLSTEDDCFLFDTVTQAKQCLESVFNGGLWMYDERYGKVRYYIDCR